MSFAEYNKILEKAAPHLGPVVITAMNTGMRQGELRKLKWSYVDRKKGFIRLPAKITKTQQARVILINHHVEAVLAGLVRSMVHDYVFTYGGVPITDPSGWQKSFSTACKNAHVPYGVKRAGGLTFRDIRTTVKTNMLRSGVDPVYRDLILGHSLGKMDRFYMKPKEDDLAAAMEKYTGWVDEQLKASNIFKEAFRRAGN